MAEVEVEELKRWNRGTLEERYAVIFLPAPYFSVSPLRVSKEPIYVALGVKRDGSRGVLILRTTPSRRQRGEAVMKYARTQWMKYYGDMDCAPEGASRWRREFDEPIHRTAKNAGYPPRRTTERAPSSLRYLRATTQFPLPLERNGPSCGKTHTMPSTVHPHLISSSLEGP
jgi:hypothetical protein